MRLPLLFSLLLMVNAQAAFDTSPTPPSADRRPKDVTVHGDKRIDDYFWLREKENPDVIAHLKAENAYTEAVMAQTKPLQEKLYKEMLGRIQENDLSVPYRKGDYTYFTRTLEGKQYVQFCRRPLTPKDAPEEVILDVNELAKGEKFMSIGGFEVSDNGLLLAYSIDRNGHRDYEIQVKDLRTGALLESKIGVASSFEWAADNETLFVSREEPDSKRSYLIERFSIRTHEASPVLEEKDEMFDVHVGRTLDGRYILLSSGSKTSSEVHYVDASAPYSAPSLFLARKDDVEYSVEHRDGLFYIVTNEGAKNFKVLTTPVTKIDRSNWKEWIAHNPAIKIENIDLFTTHAVVHEREGGLPHLRVVDFKTGAQRRIPLPEPVYNVSPDANAEYAATSYRYRYESLVTPSSVFEYDFATGKSTLLKQTPVLGGYDPTLYRSERQFAVAKDGTRIPLSIVYRIDRRETGPQPLYLYAYGSYGMSMPDSFSIRRLSLLDRGVIFVIAHIRGGGELGEEWRDQGKMALKMNTFTDFIASAEHLIGQHLTTREKLVINGGSAGGLLMGAVVNLRPDLFRAAIYDVPFVDVINTMLDDTLPLTTAEYLEWGNPNIKEQYAWMRAYSPYDNVKAQAYPLILINTSLNDSQVPYWEGAKIAAKIRQYRTDSGLTLLRTNMDAGHGGASGRYDALREAAISYAFALTALDIKE